VPAPDVVKDLIMAASRGVAGLHALVLLTALAAGSIFPLAAEDLTSLTPPVLLPDGTEFKTWEKPLSFSKTWHVAVAHPGASDANPGTKAEPFKTIDRAAQVLQPGERVVVAEGVYREWVRPRRGGEGPDKMISYQAAPGAKVVIKGSRALRVKWDDVEPSAPGGAKVWSAALPPDLFAGYNPFQEVNISDQQFVWMDWARPQKGKVPYTLRPALVFQGGVLLIQAATRGELEAKAGAFWSSADGATLFLRPRDGADPAEVDLEVTTQRSVFAPETMGLGYIHVKGFTVEHAAAPFPMPQEGAISTTRGHHWIIEDCTVRWANGVGIDIGNQFWGLPQPPEIGRHIVRRNTVTDCGVCGIAGLKAVGCLIEENALLRNAFHDAERYYETAAIKTHLNENTLIRHNVIDGTLHGSGIWMDFANVNSRCTRNVILRTSTIHGGIFIEASSRPNLIDQNVIWETRGSGIYEHDGRGQVLAHNFIAKSTGAGIRSQGKVTDRKVHGEPIVGGAHKIRNNILIGNAKPVETRGPASDIEGSLEDGIEAALDPATAVLVWIVRRPVVPGRRPDVITHDFFGIPRADPEAMPGPFVRLPFESTKIRLWPVP
jgi:alpha-N-arabinofuranosidase